MVELITYTPNPEEVLKLAYSQCYQKPAKVETILKHIDHQSVLEHISFTFKAQISRSCLAQLSRHRIMSLTVESQRYVSYENGFEYYMPPTIANHWETAMYFKETMEMLQDRYNRLIQLGVKKEDARYILPNATMCNLVFTMNLRSLINFWQLRTSSHAQKEIGDLAFETRDLVFDTLPNIKDAILKLINDKQNIL